MLLAPGCTNKHAKNGILNGLQTPDSSICQSLHRWWAWRLPILQPMPRLMPQGERVLRDNC